MYGDQLVIAEQNIIVSSTPEFLVSRLLYLVMAACNTSSRGLIGRPPSHWLYDASSMTFDLTRPLAPNFPVPSLSASVPMTTTTKSLLISPPKTALVIIDMQNFFLSTHLGRTPDSAGNKAAQRLLETAIPAARKAAIQIIWLNWGLTDSEIEEMPPNFRRAFGFEASLEHNGRTVTRPVIDALGVNHSPVERPDEEAEGLTENGKPERIYRGLGSEIGSVAIEAGKTVGAGRLLMRDTWNAALPPAMEAVYKEGQDLKVKPDVWIHKNRMSGLWGSSTLCTDYLEKEGITTLMFAGVNTDQCVSGSLQDAFTKGWDCILLRDACGTTSPIFASECIEYNCALAWGFVTDCSALEEGVKVMLNAKEKCKD